MQAACLSDLLLHPPDGWQGRELLGTRGRRGWQWMSFAQTSKRVLRVARWLHSIGIRHGDRVGLLGHNSPQWCIADFAILHIGAVTVPAYFTDPPEAVRYVFEDSGCKLLLVEPGEQQAKLDASKAPVFCLRGEQGITLQGISGDTMFDIPCDLPAVGRDDLATLIYTSGTTGKPKGVMLTHGNLLSDVAAGLGSIPVFDTDTFLSFLPVSHAFERTVGHFLPIACGSGIAYAEDITTLLRDIPEVRPSVMISVPRLYEKIYAGVRDKLLHAPALKRQLFERARQLGLRRFELRLEGKDLQGMDAFAFRILDRLVHARIRRKMGGRLRLFVSGGAALHPDIARFLLAAGLNVCPGYGLSEASPVLTVNPASRIKPDTVGPALPGVELKLAADGELMARGEMVMRGYWQQPEDTAAVLEADGWLHTGDIAEIDDEGYVRIVDRKKELLVLSNGEKVPPASVEKRLAIDPVILQAMIIGDQRPSVTALVVPDEAGMARYWQKEKGGSLPADWRGNADVHAWLLKRMHAACEALPNYMQVQDFAFVEEEWSQASGTLTPTLKFKRRNIMEQHQAEIEALYEEDGA